MFRDPASDPVALLELNGVLRFRRERVLDEGDRGAGATASSAASRPWLDALPKIQPPPCMYKTTGSCPSTPRGLMSKALTSPTSAGTVIHASSTSGIGTPACAPSIDLRTSSSGNSGSPGPWARYAAICAAGFSRLYLLVELMLWMLCRPRANRILELLSSRCAGVQSLVRAGRGTSLLSAIANPAAWRNGRAISTARPHHRESTSISERASYGLSWRTPLMNSIGVPRTTADAFSSHDITNDSRVVPD